MSKDARTLALEACTLLDQAYGRAEGPSGSVQWEDIDAAHAAAQAALAAELRENAARAAFEAMQHAASLRRAAQAWTEEQTTPHRSGNVGRDCLALGWRCPDDLRRAADTKEREAGLLAKF